MSISCICVLAFKLINIWFDFSPIRSYLLLSVSVNQNEIEVMLKKGEDVHSLCKFNVTGISILPATCNRLQMSSDGSLHLRFQVKREAANTLCSQDPQCNGASRNSNLWTNQVSDVVSVLSGESYAVLCRMCAYPIVQNKKWASNSSWYVRTVALDSGLSWIKFQIQ